MFVEGGIRYPVMIDALNGGGRRGMRVISAEEGVEEAFKRFVEIRASCTYADADHFRCMGESPSCVEKALPGPGWKHIEVQIVGDGAGDVVHLWERECSVQRRFQNVVERPSPSPGNPVEYLLAPSVNMALAWRYQGVGTFEYLVNSRTGKQVFLESIVGPAFDSRSATIVVRAGDLGGGATQWGARALTETSGARAEGVIRTGTEVFKARAGGLGVQGRQDAGEVAVSSTSWSEPGLLAMLPAAICRVDLSPPGSEAPQTRRSTPWRSPPSRSTLYLLRRHLRGCIRPRGH
ncbi:hypothetical protein FIBSPDRAFT_148493 [Athelia psychrophila]|uniref:Carbamoyl phosphate synthase ATP-binding domain-containing protein n=1 Tax=Athelia psychrophila TaxID=1759441 RepID=A0A166BNZ7_9AGAM|nr:hypothetical protein FIBSPDRAFT_148493 [Fibularhizoctonia sp. CBS 109695]